MARCLVTGGAGFIGSHIVDALVAQGDEVRVFDNLSTCKKENLSQLESKVELVVGDLRDKTALEQALNGIDYVFHVAALRAVLRSVDDPQETNDVNVTGTQYIAECCYMKNVINAIKGLLKCRFISQIPNHKLDFRLQLAEVFLFTSGQIVEHAHFVTLRNKRIHNVRTYKTRAAGNQTSCHGLCSL